MQMQSFSSTIYTGRAHNPRRLISQPKIAFERAVASPSSTWAKRGEIGRCGGFLPLTSDEDVGGEEEGEDAAHEDSFCCRGRLRRRGRVGLAGGGGHRDGAGKGRSTTAGVAMGRRRRDDCVEPWTTDEDLPLTILPFHLPRRSNAPGRDSDRNISSDALTSKINCCAALNNIL